MKFIDTLSFAGHEAAKRITNLYSELEAAKEIAEKSRKETEEK